MANLTETRRVMMTLHPTPPALPSSSLVRGHSTWAWVPRLVVVVVVQVVVVVVIVVVVVAAVAVVMWWEK